MPYLTKRTLAVAAGILWMRLRFVIAIVGLFAIIAFWRQVGSLWDRTVAWASGQTAAERGVAPDAEYFCPMCPGVLSGWPEKCPVCKMPLVRRARGTSQLLPEGVMARMQISPYRVQLAGIQTSPVGYLPLTHDIRTTGRMLSPSAPAEDSAAGTRTVVATIAPWDIPFAETGAPVELRSASLPAGTVVNGHVADVSTAGELHIRVEDSSAAVPVGIPVEITARIPLSSVEPYRSQPRGKPPLSTGSRNSYFQCPDHPAWIRAAGGKCPFDERDLEEHSLRDDQRLYWSCRWHADVFRDGPAETCDHCQRRCATLRVVNYVPAGEVLVVPESAVIDLGSLRLVYVESMPGMFDGVAVELGTKEEGYYPVLSGLEPGQRVATAGAFLLDAETRLNPSLAASYFGAGTASASAASSSLLAGVSPAVSTPDQLASFGLTHDDLMLARRQKTCPITRMPLGSMGPPVRMEVAGEPVFLCCEACRDSVRQPKAEP